MKFNNKFFRVYAITTDRHGIDPFMDKVIPKIMSISRYAIHDVTADERGAPDLISYKEYGSEDYWWHILAYNAISSYRDVVEGISLRIPDLGSIIAITNQVLTENVQSTNNIAVI